MNAPPMMKCGHAANGESAGERVCVACSMAGIPDARVVDDSPPDLTGRTARCSYYGSTPNGRNHESNYGCQRGEPCRCEQPSRPGLPFFGHRPDAPHDEFFCGCWGWD